MASSYTCFLYVGLRCRALYQSIDWYNALLFCMGQREFLGVLQKEENFMKPKRLISLLVAVCMMVALLPVSAVTAFAADIPTLGEDEFDYQGLRYKKLSSSTVSVVGPVEVQTERVIPETVVNNGTTYTVTEIGPYAFSRDTTKSKYTAYYNRVGTGYGSQPYSIPTRT